MFSMFYEKGVVLKAELSMFCRKKGGNAREKSVEKGLKLSTTDKHGCHFYPSAPHPDT